jgi:hypothetical protein
MKIIIATKIIKKIIIDFKVVILYIPSLIVKSIDPKDLIVSISNKL